MGAATPDLNRITGQVDGRPEIALREPDHKILGGGAHSDVISETRGVWRARGRGGVPEPNRGQHTSFLTSERRPSIVPCSTSAAGGFRRGLTACPKSPSHVRFISA